MIRYIGLSLLGLAFFATSTYYYSTTSPLGAGAPVTQSATHQDPRGIWSWVHTATYPNGLVVFPLMVDLNANTLPDQDESGQVVTIEQVFVTPSNGAGLVRIKQGTEVIWCDQWSAIFGRGHGHMRFTPPIVLMPNKALSLEFDPGPMTGSLPAFIRISGRVITL
jgi:hypothetical protein